MVTFTIIFRGVRQGSYLSASAVDDWAGSYIKDVKRGDNVILSTQLITEFVKGFTELIRIAVTLIPIVLIYLPLIYEIYPPSREALQPMFDTLKEMIFSGGQGFINFLPVLFMWVITAKKQKRFLI